MSLTDPADDNGNTLKVTFAKSPDDGPSGSVTSYTVLKRTEGKSPFAPVATITATGSKNYVTTLTGLQRSVRYGIGVRANAGGLSSTILTRWRAPLDTRPPAPPRNVSLLNPPTDDGTTMQMDFTRSLDDAIGGDVTTYRFFRRTASGAFSQVGSLPATKSETYRFLFRSLVLGTRYALAVAAFDGINESQKITIWGDTAPPAPPQNVKLADVLGDNGTALRLQFGKSPDDGGGAADVTKYNVYKRTEATAFTQVGTISATGAANYQLLLNNLNKGERLGIGVAAFDGFQESKRVTVWNTPVDDTPPAPASNLTVTDVPSDDGKALNVNFSASPDDNATAAAEVARYLVYRALSNSGTGQKVGEVTATKSAKAASYTYKDTGLTPGTTYWYWVVAAGPSGRSTPTARVSGVPADNRPVRPPLNLTAEDRPYDFGGVVDLSWSKSADDAAGLNSVTQYIVYRRMANVQGDPQKIATVPATGAAVYKWSDTQVPLELILYDYTVTAATATGAESSAAGPARAAAEDNNVLVFQPPTGLTAADVAGDTGGSILLTWYRSPSEGDVGPPPPPPVVFSSASAKGGYGGDYEFYRRTATGTYTALPTFVVSAAGTNDPMTYVDTGLTNGVKYYYKVRYRRYNQISAFTAEASATPVANKSVAQVSPDAGAANDAAGAVPSVSLQSPPASIVAGQDVTLGVSAEAGGRGTVCLEYSTGNGLSRTAAVTGSGSFEAQIRLKTANLAPGTALQVRAVLTVEGTSVASPVTTLTVVAP